jgi:hypothetical protein
MERDVLESIAARRDPEQQSVSDSSTADAVTATVGSQLEQDVKEMAEGAFRHLLVIYGVPPGPSLPLEGFAQKVCLRSNRHGLCPTPVLCAKPEQAPNKPVPRAGCFNACERASAPSSVLAWHNSLPDGILPYVKLIEE